MSEMDIKSSTADKALDIAKDFIDKLISPSAEALGILIATPFRMWVLDNQVKNLNRVKQIVDENNISLKQVKLKVLFPYLEAVALEEDATLQELWANLFVNYIDANKNFEVIIYPEILKQISTKEAEILKALSLKTEIETKNGDNQIVEEELLNNLERLGLIASPLKDTGNFSLTGGEDIRYFMNGMYVLTAFGKRFCEVCGIS